MTVIVQHADAMSDDQFWLHCERRHPLTRYVERAEHEADHRLHPTSLHTHTSAPLHSHHAEPARHESPAQACHTEAVGARIPRPSGPGIRVRSLLLAT